MADFASLLTNLKKKVTLNRKINSSLPFLVYQIQPSCTLVLKLFSLTHAVASLFILATKFV